MRPMPRACWSCPNIVCSSFARSLSLRREGVKEEALGNAGPTPRIVCAVFAGSAVTSAAAAFFPIFVQATSPPGSNRFPLLSVTSVCAGFAAACASFASALAFADTPKSEAAAAPTPSPAYFKTSRRVVTLDSPLSSNYSRSHPPTPSSAPHSILQNRYSLTQICKALISISPARAKCPNICDRKNLIGGESTKNHDSKKSATERHHRVHQCRPQRGSKETASNACVYSRIRTRSQRKPEMRDARLFLSDDTGHIRRPQKSHRLLSHAISSGRLRQGSYEIRHGYWVDPV